MPLRRRANVNAIFIVIILLMVVGLTTPQLASAGGAFLGVTPEECTFFGVQCGNPGAGNPTQAFAPIVLILYRLVQGLLALVGIVSFGVIVYCGAMYILSRGDEEVARRAKACMVYAAIGVLIAGLAGIITNAIINQVIPVPVI